MYTGLIFCCVFYWALACRNVTWLRNGGFGFQFWPTIFSSLENSIIP